MSTIVDKPASKHVKITQSTDLLPRSTNSVFTKRLFATKLVAIGIKLVDKVKFPKTPPKLSSIGEQVIKQYERFTRVMDEAQKTEAAGRYRHWDIVRHLTPPLDLSVEDLWFGIKMVRSAAIKQIPLVDKTGERFSYNLPDRVALQLHEIDLGAGGVIGLPEPITNTHTRNQYLVRSLIQEAVTSSQLEGAATTREVAKEMLRSGRPPRDKSEQMILNNFITMRQIGAWKNRRLDEDLILEIHRQITDKTLENPEAAGRFRTESERVTVQNEITGEIYHQPPPAAELQDRLHTMCAFANGETPEHFIHPVLRAIILHFWLAYDHPFVDGNGRTARVLFYWLMLRQGYWLFEYISISEILVRAPVKYALSFLYAETDGNDLTYFIIHQAKVIRKSIEVLHKYIDEKSKELSESYELLRAGPNFNYRQQALIAHAMRNPGTRYTVEAHKTSHSIAYDTARRDLLDLAEKGVLEVRKQGKAFVFIAPSDLHSKVRQVCKASGKNAAVS
jgi:Fic family protein